MQTPASLRIMAGEYHDLMRKGFEAVLPEIPAGIQPFTAKSAEDALQFFDHFNPHVVLLDYDLPGMKGDECRRKIKEQRPEVKVIVLSYHKEPAIIEAMVSSGADGYVFKSATVGELATAIEIVMAGGFYFSGDSANVAANHGLKKLKRIRANHTEMSAREKEVMKIIYGEHTTAEIAEKLNMTASGVETARKRIYIIAKVKGVVGLIKYIFKNGLDGYSER